MYIFSQKPGREKSIMKFRYLQEVNTEYLNPSGMCPQSLGLMNHTVLSEVQIILEIWHGGKSDGKWQRIQSSNSPFLKIMQEEI